MRGSVNAAEDARHLDESLLHAEIADLRWHAYGL